jgi:hypothetical protein
VLSSQEDRDLLPSAGRIISIMKNLLILLAASFLCMNSGLSHGIGGRPDQPESGRDVSKERQASSSGKSFEQPPIEKSSLVGRYSLY